MHALDMSKHGVRKSGIKPKMNRQRMELLIYVSTTLYSHKTPYLLIFTGGGQRVRMEQSLL